MHISSCVTSFDEVAIYMPENKHSIDFKNFSVEPVVLLNHQDIVTISITLSAKF
jgi:hypothetical protein